MFRSRDVAFCDQDSPDRRKASVREAGESMLQASVFVVVIKKKNHERDEKLKECCSRASTIKISHQNKDRKAQEILTFVAFFSSLQYHDKDLHLIVKGVKFLFDFYEDLHLRVERASSM
ncbi:hypothetical protein HPP92_012157 [Vanilla planifolia]|uniref:Uncharacterized protein n=1 Tax=Vanilla planifolia TaxID=51239 RepID=A0A835UZ49_VANPL|nr:hypothetical protein HPP92_012157 [Vanilla planifolia]